MKRMVIAAIAILIATASLAQDAAESIEVRVVNVDVIVRDRAGKPVTGLTKDDFEIYENGQKREITNLYEVRAPAAHPIAAAAAAADRQATAPAQPAAEIRPRNIVMFVDNYSLTPFRRDKVLQSLQKFVDEKLLPQDKAMLVLCTQQVKVITPFTSDRKAIRDGIESMRKMGSGGQNRAAALDQVKDRIQQFIDAAHEPKIPLRPTLSPSEYYSLSTTLVDTFVEEEITNSRNTLTALGQVTAALAGLEGKNVIIFAGAHLPENPGRETYQWLYNVFSQTIPGLTMSAEALHGRAGSMQHYSIEEAARQASANNVALYMIDAADARDAVSAENSEVVEKTEQFAQFTNTGSAYQTLARLSGGLALIGSENFDVAFDTLANDLSSYYALGFKPSDTATAGLRTIVVKMKNPEYRFRARETYMPASKPILDEMSARVIANLYTTDARNVWEISLKPGVPEKQGSDFRVPFEVTIAPTITLVPQDENLVGNFAVFVAVGNGENTSKVTRNVHAVKVPVDAEDDFREKKITYKASITMTPGNNILSVAVVDQANKNAGFARAKVAVP